MNQNRPIARCISLAAILVFSQTVYGQEEASPLDALNWVAGPAVASVTSRAEIELPEGFLYLNPHDTGVLMEAMENPSSGNEYFVGRDDMSWFAVFSYEDTGYIRDDEEIDPDQLLESLRANTEVSNEVRRERGWAEMRIVDWAYEPFYESDTQRLAWAIIGESAGQQVINYNTRILGRTGVMSATLVGDPASLEQDVEEFKAMLKGFGYTEGNTYAEFRDGDKVAQYGLAALVAGGAAAAVAKSGVWKVVLKFIWIPIVAFLALVKSLWGRLSGRNGG